MWIRMFSFLLLWMCRGANCGMDLPDFHFQGGDSLDERFRLGLAMGVAYKETIQLRMKRGIRKMTPFLESPQGQETLGNFLRTHWKLVPELMHEMKGIAHGSDVAFETIFAMSLREELSYFSGVRGPAVEDHCSDYMLCTRKHCAVGHNEDGDLPDRHFFVGFIHLGSSNFTVLNYAGDLPGGMSAMAFNSAGLAFSLNYVGPERCSTEGLGRNFVSRLLLDAQTWEKAIAIITQRHAAGHNYQLIDFAARRVANVEVANDMYAVREISKPFYHANQYQTLNVPGQRYSNSSTHRLQRVQRLPIPESPDEVLKILGDQGDQSYPIFHDKYSHDHGDLSDWTLSSVLFDLDSQTISIMDGNPAKLKVSRKFRLSLSDVKIPAVWV